MEKSKFSWKKRGESFKYAFAGISRLISHEHNAWIHCVVAVLVIVAGFLFNISANEWLAIIVCIGGVLAAEGFNSAIEALADRVNSEYDEAVKHTKDLAAGAVLLFVFAAVAVGLIIFLPKLILMF